MGHECFEFLCKTLPLLLHRRPHVSLVAAAGRIRPLCVASLVLCCAAASPPGQTFRLSQPFPNCVVTTLHPTALVETACPPPRPRFHRQHLSMTPALILRQTASIPPNAHRTSVLCCFSSNIGATTCLPSNRTRLFSRPPMYNALQAPPLSTPASSRKVYRPLSKPPPSTRPVQCNTPTGTPIRSFCTRNIIKIKFHASHCKPFTCALQKDLFAHCRPPHPRSSNSCCIHNVLPPC